LTQIPNLASSLSFVLDESAFSSAKRARLFRNYFVPLLVGVDNSAAMLERARAAYSNITWIQADLAHWFPPALQDLIFANASLQWVPDHAELLQGLCVRLRPCGVLAFQMPFIHQTVPCEVAG